MYRVVCLVFLWQVVGVDVSARLFDACVRLQTERQMTAIDTCDGSTARIDACIGSSLDTSRVVFKQVGILKWGVSF